MKIEKAYKIGKKYCYYLICTYSTIIVIVMFFWQFHEYDNLVWKEMRLGAVLELSFIMKFLLILNLIFLCVVFSVHYINIMVIEGLIWILHIHMFFNLTLEVHDYMCHFDIGSKIQCVFTFFFTKNTSNYYNTTIRTPNSKFFSLNSPHGIKL